MYFDTHAHYYADAFDADRDEVLAALPSQGAELILCPGCDLETSRACVDLAARFPHVYAAVGYHPEDLEGVELAALSEIRALAARPKVKAIGEIGLDYYWVKDDAGRAKEREFFHAQLDMADELGLPAIVHDRDAHKDTLDAVRAHPNSRGVFHCYAGSVEDAKVLVKLGWMLSFTGNITFKNARRAIEVLEWLPMEHIMLETDAPYMTPEPHRGKRCDSSYIPLMAARIGAVKGLRTEEVLRITCENGKRFFAI
ncbi:MAG: TatD family deoxyribonuclease [Clostridia bacterium]|nr:TatD family deoxyribonuclease [Clostridia bacterium]